MNIVELYEIFKQHPSVQTDTRKLKKGDLFFALRGPNYNANEFAKTAIENGAAFAVIDDPDFSNEPRTILTTNVLDTLQQLALYHRNQFNIPIIALTGSNGKTTTKELIYSVLSTTFRTIATEGNLNNHIGVPLTLLRIQPDTEIAVIEMGANHVGEIASYCTFTRPGYGLITNIGKAHLEGFGSMEGVKKAKGELFDHLRQNEGVAFVKSDDEVLRELSHGIKEVILFGGVAEDDRLVTGSIIRSEPFLTVSIPGMEIRTKIVGSYNLPNLLGAIAIGKYFGVNIDNMRRALENYSPSNSRSQWLEKDGNKIILDAYNANPSSMRAAIENFANLPGKNKVLILGAMAELGSESIMEHQEIADLADKHNFKDVVFVGGDFLRVNTRSKTFPNVAAARTWLQQQRLRDGMFLIKGSRSMKMENILDEPTN